MAEITRRDVMLLLVMALAIVSMSMVFPALGLTNEDSVSASEIPEFDLETDRFDIAGELPERPSTTDSGRLTYRADGFDDRQVWIEHNADYGVVSAEVFAINGNQTPPIQVQLTEFDGSSGAFIDQETAELTEVGDRVELRADNQTDYTVRYELVELENSGTGEFEATVQFDVVESPGGEGFLGALLGAGDALASTLAWVGLVFYWFSVTLFEIAGNVLVMVFDVTSYFIGLMAWMTTTYGAVVTGASGWVSVFVALPGIIFSAVLGKLVVIGIGLLPTT